ncbi:MAG TPA: hypothetical protein VLX92_35425 [Kofleriaceae bacterium]|nr:hypothetical protein [Kofleriaceae bacterium]
MVKVVAATLVTLIGSAHGETLAAPAAGAAIAIPGGRVACGAPGGGWTLDAAHRAVKPPAQAAPGARSELAVAASDAACARDSAPLALVVVAPPPAVDRAVIALDAGQLELHGHHLAGAIARWRSADRTGATSCDAPRPDGTGELCDLPEAADPGASWSVVPAGARGEPDEHVFDAEGRAAPPAALAIERTELAMLVRPDAVIDAFAGGGVVPLRHAELIAAVDCAPASCVLDGDGLLVDHVPAGAPSLAVRVHLGPRVVLRQGDAVETSPVVAIPVVRCPLAVASGAPLRGIDAQTIVVRVGGRCARELDELTFEVGGVPAERLATPGQGYVALRIGRSDAAALAIVARTDQGVIAQVRAATRAAPAIRIALELAHRAIDFIPTNVAATARVSSGDWDGTLALAAIDGVYAVDRGAVRGVPPGGGAIALRVALHRRLAAPLGDLEIATISEPIQRPLREATSAAPLFGERPLVELLCDAGAGVTALPAGATAHVPFDRHDSCRLVLHRERLDPALGAQHLTLEVDVARVDGSPRSEAHVARRLELAHDDTPRTLWLRGAESRFDRYTVRLSQDDDERAHDDELPSAQWSIVTGRGRARLYATSAIPTGLYRVSDRDHSGILTLNFGVLARLTWLDSLGREGILSAEAGVLTVGLAGDTSATGKSLTQVATVAGLGLSVPIANRALAAETSVNLHAWVELEPSRAFGGGSGSAWAFVFGPSITVGNLGADL